MARSVWNELMKVGCPPAIMCQDMGCSRGKFTGDALDGIGRDAGDTGCPFRSVRKHRICQLVKPGGLIGHGTAVIQAFSR